MLPEPNQHADTVRPDPPDWRCRCGETNPPEFGTCWLCGAFEEERMSADYVQCLTDEERAAICAERGHHRVSQAPSTVVIRPRRCVVCDTPTDDAGEALLPDEVVTPAPRQQVDEETLAALIDGPGGGSDEAQ